MANAAPIGIFDSGIGGLTVFSAIKRRLPHEALIYLGDTARVPYGTKSRDTVVRYAVENTAFLEARGVKAIVVACNTASALALEALRERVRIPLIGVVEPGAKVAAGASRSKCIGVVGTQATVASDAYGKALRECDSRVRVVSEVCSLFVPLVEEGWLDGEIVEAIAWRYLGGIKQEGIDTLILGCTHYPLLKGIIGKVMGGGVALVDSGEATAGALAMLLDERGLIGSRPSLSADQVFVTDVPARFEAIAHRFLGGALPQVHRVHL